MADLLRKRGIIEITNIAADWDWKSDRPDDLPEIPRINSIRFNPGAANDVMYIKDGNDGGPEAFYVMCETAYDQRIEYYHGSRVVPFIDFSECTLSAGHKVVIKLWRDF